MSFGQTEKPCDQFKHWFGNGHLCGKCAWERKDHKVFPIVNEIVFALIFDDNVVGYKMWNETNCNWMYSKSYNRQSNWTFDPPKEAYSKIELVRFYSPNMQNKTE
jgi:hypothetical protein